jgi:peptidoglycan hydrolase CwlO-like protein
MISKRNLLWVVAVALVLAGPAGCGKKEIDELKLKTTQLEKELAETKTKLADKEKAVAEARNKADQNQANIDALTAEIVKVKVERDKLKQELAALKKRQ